MRGSVLLTSGNVVQAGLAFAVNLVLVRYISPEEFGRFAVVFAEVSLFYAFVSFKTNTLIIRASEQNYTDRFKDMMHTLALQETLAATLIALAWIYVTGGIGGWDIVIVVAIGVRHWTGLNRAYYERDMPYHTLAYIETGAAAASQLVALGLVLGGFGWQALVLRELALTLIGLAALAAVGGVTLRRLTLMTVDDYRQIYRDARGAWVDGALEGTFQRLSILLAGYVGGDGIAGYLFQAQRLAALPQMVLAPFTNRVSVNWFARVEDGKARSAGRDRALRWLFAGLSVAAVATVLLAADIVPWLFGEAWRPAAAMMVAMAGFIVFAAPFDLLRGYCVAVRQMRRLAIGRVVQHVALAVPLVLVPLGIVGIGDALAAGISLAFAAAFLTVYLPVIRAERAQK